MSPLTPDERAPRETCRRCRDEGRGTAVPARFIVWGKMFKPEALGPRCYACVSDQCGRDAALRPGQYAIFDLGDCIAAGEAADRARHVLKGVERTHTLVPRELLRDIADDLREGERDPGVDRRRLAALVDLLRGESVTRPTEERAS